MLSDLLVVAVICLASPPSEAPPLTATYLKVAPAVVGITCEAGQPYFGTGTVIDPRGLVVTSVTVVPRDARKIRVYLHGGIVLSARTALWNAEKELTVLKIEPATMPNTAPATESAKVPRDFPFVRLGDSDSLQVGEPALTLGNAFQSIEDDDQVALGEGVVSGLYTLVETPSESKYKGRVIETTAHVNDGMDGGALVDEKGDLVGILCLNYSRNRWLGTAVPINDLKPLIAAERGWISDRQEDYPAYAGLEVEEVGGVLVSVLRVFPESPAFLAGLRTGDRCTSAQEKPIASVKDLREVLASSKAGDVLRLVVERDGKAIALEIHLWGKSWRWV